MDMNLIWKAALVSAAIGAAAVAHYVFRAKDDNVVEELAEKVIKEETGADVDLSPSSPEKK